VVESNARRISRCAAPDGTLTDREVYGPQRLQGIRRLRLRRHCNLWMTYVISDRIAVITPEGDEQIVFDDGDAAKISAFDRHFFAGTVTPSHDGLWGTVALDRQSHFGGADLQTLYIGSLRGTTIPYVRAPAPGLPMVHCTNNTDAPAP